MAGKRIRLSTVGARVPALGVRVQVLDAPNQNATPRMRGRRWMVRRARWLREHPLCAKCLSEGRSTAADEVDHRVPLYKGGADDETNLQSLCTPHHKLKTAEEAPRGGV